MLKDHLGKREILDVCFSPAGKFEKIYKGPHSCSIPSAAQQRATLQPLNTSYIFKPPNLHSERPLLSLLKERH